MQTPKVSIIVPIYNVEKYLDRCIQSLLGQTLTDIEIIMVDDGSPDRCPQMCDEYAEKDSRIKVIHKSNAGLGYARNSGLEIATGEYVAFVDSDDYVDTRMYESLYASAQQENADAVFCGFYTEVKKGKWIESNEVLENKVWKGDAVRNFMLDMIASAPYVKQERKYQMSVWHSIYRRAIIKDNNISFFSERYVVSEDIPFQVDFLSNAKTVTYLKQVHYRYCLNGTSLTKSFKIEKYNGYKNLRTLLLSKLNDDISRQRIERLFIGYCRSFLYNLIDSNRENKIGILNSIETDIIWKEIKLFYHTNWLPLHSRICFLLIIYHKPLITFLYIKITDCLRKRR